MLPKFKPQQITLMLSLALAIKTSRGFAQEDYGSYRHEFYREDDHRMSVDTDSAAFDIGLGAHARLTGEFVLDSISGATPNGAPPQSQWPFPTFTTYYNRAYNLFFQTAINDPSNKILYDAGIIPSYTDYTNYIASVNPQLGTLATNAANGSLAQLTNSPHYHNSTQVPLTQLRDLRRAFSLGAPITFGIHQFTPQISVSKEGDYHSYGAALNYAVQLNKKNTTLNFGWSHNSDRVRDETLVMSTHVIWQGKISDDFLIGINQLLTPKSYLTLNLTYGQEYGYLSDPYRGVMTLLPDPQETSEDVSLRPENRPRRRTKEIAYMSYTQFFEPANGSMELGYRFFHDSYGIFAHTLETAWHQKIGRHLVFTPAFRYYYQTSASFYNVIFFDASNLPAYYSSDYRLSQLQTVSASATLNYRVQKHFSVDIGYTRYIMQGLDGITSPSAYPSANVYNIGGRIWF